jgi:hypothetical protein
MADLIGQQQTQYKSALKTPRSKDATQDHPPSGVLYKSSSRIPSSSSAARHARKNVAATAITFVAKSEDAGVPTLRDRIEVGSTVYADEASHWDHLHARYLTKRINHSTNYSDCNGTSTNQAESFFSRPRRAFSAIRATLPFRQAVHNNSDC